MPITRMAVQVRAFCAVKGRSEYVGRGGEGAQRASAW